MARGLLPVQTASAHWLAHPRSRSAVAEFLLARATALANTSTSSTSGCRFRRAILKR